ncbi:MAG: hypothetical protein IH933_16925, partial [Euryarchaeota archaeon]|nr:hypothetical protein [Euryarchaeota archaeon]
PAQGKLPLLAQPAGQELGNLIDHPEYGEVRTDLETRLVERMRETDDPLAQWTGDVLGG